MEPYLRLNSDCPISEEEREGLYVWLSDMSFNVGGNYHGMLLYIGWLESNMDTEIDEED